MSVHRYCEGCGRGIGYPEWLRAAYCSHCGSRLLKSTRSLEEGGAEQCGTTKSVLWFREVQSVVTRHPLIVSAGSITGGAALMMLAPHLMPVGLTLMGIGAGVLLLSCWVVSSGGAVGPLMSMGAMLFAAGAGVYAASYVLMAVGGLSIVAGVGIGTTAGVCSAIKYVERRKLEKTMLPMPVV